ncbi:MAG: hypothetical protein KKB31_00585 [Nanoarchaeota archaeon]|nr:hypothetical protein [Nanoarchaeota archaeon]
MKRITGSWVRNYDAKETVASVWPYLEEALEGMGYSFSIKYSLLPNLDDLKMIGFMPEYQGGCDKASENLEQSRGSFIRNMNKFGYYFSSTGLERNPGAGSSILNVPLIYFFYEHSINEDGISLQFLPGRYNPNQLFHPSKDGEKNDRVVQRRIDASELIIRVNSKPSVERELKNIYRKLSTK